MRKNLDEHDRGGELLALKIKIESLNNKPAYKSFVGVGRSMSPNSVATWAAAILDEDPNYPTFWERDERGEWVLVPDWKQIADLQTDQRWEDLGYDDASGMYAHGRDAAGGGDSSGIAAALVTAINKSSEAVSGMLASTAKARFTALSHSNLTSPHHHPRLHFIHPLWPVPFSSSLRRASPDPRPKASRRPSSAS